MKQIFQNKVFSLESIIISTVLSVGIGIYCKKTAAFPLTWPFTVFIIFTLLLGIKLIWHVAKQTPSLGLYNMDAKQRALTILFVALFFIGFSLLMAKLWPWGADYYLYFYPLGEQWIGGYRNIYDGIASNLFYPPWSLFVIVPLAFLPVETAHGFQFVISVAIILAGLRILNPKTSEYKYIFLSLFNLHTFDLLHRGQLDAIVLFGAILGFWAISHKKPLWLSLAFCLMAMKPPLNVLLVYLFYLILIRSWGKKDIAISFSLPFVMIFVSSIAVGIDWPIAYVKNLSPPYTLFSISIWNGLSNIGFPHWPVFILAFIAILFFFRIAWKEGSNFYTLGIALATTFIFIPYANSDHYVLLLPAFILVLQKLPFLGILAYATTWIPLLSEWWGPSTRPISVLYPIILLLGAYMIRHKENITIAKEYD